MAANAAASFNASQQHLAQQQQQQRAGSVSPGTAGAENNRGILYAELQFPVTSNYGSMKKRSQRDSANTTASTSVHSGEPSPNSQQMMLSMNEGLDVAGNGNNNNNTSSTRIPSAQSLDNVHRYVPDYVAISNRKTAV